MLPGATDRLFLVFCRTGDARALGVVFDRTAPELLRVALYLCGDHADADDLVQRIAFAGERFAGMFGNMAFGTRVRLWLLPGRYTVEVRSGDGRRARGELTIAGLDDHPAITVELPAK